MLFISLLFTAPMQFFFTLAAVIFSVCVHEYCHARTALAFGDSTAADAGHLTLNPLKQMGPFSVIMLLLAGLAWGAVPVNPYRLTRRGRIFTSLAGPLANLCLFMFAWVVIFTCVRVPFEVHLPLPVMVFILIFGHVNALLGFINILPVPGFDGWNILKEFFHFREIRSDWGKGIVIFVIFLLVMSFDWLAKIASWLMQTAILAGKGGYPG